VEVNLDDLLAESIAAVADAGAAKAAKDRVKRGGQSQAERQEDLERIAAWEAAYEWEAQANVALFHWYTCTTCDAGTTNGYGLFQGLFIREQHKSLQDAKRWRRVEASKAMLPNETAIRFHEVPMCTECCTGNGWDLDAATVWEG
jgi:hypothetical protein